MFIHRYFKFQRLSPIFDYIYLRQYLELWKVTICKTTGLGIVFRNKYIFPWNLIKWKNLQETYSISISPFFVGRLVQKPMWILFQKLPYVVVHYSLSNLMLSLHFSKVVRERHFTLKLSYCWDQCLHSLTGGWS